MRQRRRHYLIRTPYESWWATHIEWGDTALKCWGHDGRSRRPRVFYLPYAAVRVVEDIDPAVLPRRRRPQRRMRGTHLVAGDKPSKGRKRHGSQTRRHPA